MRLNKPLLISFITLTITALTLLSKHKQLLTSMNQPPTVIHKENGFTVVTNSNPWTEDLRIFDRVVDVFGIKVYATKTVSFKNLIHVCKLLAGFLDNDNNGEVDNAYTHEVLRGRHSSIGIFKDELEQLSFSEYVMSIQKIVNFYSMDESKMFPHKYYAVNDVYSLEHTCHLVTSGWALGYPQIYGWDETSKSQLTAAMDIARGGHFTTIPQTYALTAWFNSTQAGCDYKCMARKYTWWVLSSVLGIQEFRIKDKRYVIEWKLPLRSQVKEFDKLGFYLMTDKKYKLPQNIPNSNYTYTSTPAESLNNEKKFFSKVK